MSDVTLKFQIVSIIVKNYQKEIFIYWAANTSDAYNTGGYFYIYFNILYYIYYFINK